MNNVHFKYLATINNDKLNMLIKTRPQQDKEIEILKERNLLFNIVSSKVNLENFPDHSLDIFLNLTTQEVLLFQLLIKNTLPNNQALSNPMKNASYNALLDIYNDLSSRTHDNLSRKNEGVNYLIEIIIKRVNLCSIEISSLNVLTKLIPTKCYLLGKLIMNVI